jgi:peptide/nickel transport system permease protein
MKGYRAYFGKKAFWYLITLCVAVFLNFLLPRLVPGNPVQSIISSMTAGIADTDRYKQIYNTFAAEFGIDKPIWQQFVIYVGNLFRGDLGQSFSLYPRSVSSIIASALPWTLMLQIPAILVGWLLGNLLGALAAYMKGVWDRAVFPAFLFLSAIPPFSMALILVWLLANTLHWFPGSLGYDFDMVINWQSLRFWGSVLSHYRLPFLSMVLVTIGGQSLGMREMSIYELNADYVKYSRLMGIHDRKIVGYVFRNAMLPQITGLALSLGTMIGGALITEIVFSYPGLGTTMFRAISSQDYPLISGCTLIITVMVLITNFIVDIVCGLIDPRVKATQQEEG